MLPTDSPPSRGSGSRSWPSGSPWSISLATAFKLISFPHSPITNWKQTFHYDCKVKLTIACKGRLEDCIIFFLSGKVWDTIMHLPHFMIVFLGALLSLFSEVACPLFSEVTSPLFSVVICSSLLAISLSTSDLFSSKRIEEKPLFKI